MIAPFPINSTCRSRKSLPAGSVKPHFLDAYFRQAAFFGHRPPTRSTQEGGAAILPRVTGVGRQSLPAKHIRTMIKRLQAAGLRWAPPEELTDAALEARLVGDVGTK